jgi:putative transcriptional regulator
MNAKGMKKVKLTIDDYSLHEEDWKLFDSLSDEEVMARAGQDPDALPSSSADLKKFRRSVNVKELRLQLDMTQEQFAGTFHLSLATLRDWEQARSQPDQAAHTLLKVIAHDPDLVKKALET